MMMMPAPPPLAAAVVHTVTITGKHNVDKLVHGKKAKCPRAVMQENVTEVQMSAKEQLAHLIQYFMNANDDVKLIDGTTTQVMLRELRNKVSGYKAQDLKRELYNEKQLITLDEVVEKLVASKLRCCYCSVAVVIFYKNVRDLAQWTLDRVDNDVGHSAVNTVIACLKCNLQRRRQNEEKFMFTKKLKILRINND